MIECFDAVYVHLSIVINSAEQHVEMIAAVKIFGKIDTLPIPRVASAIRIALTFPAIILIAA